MATVELQRQHVDSHAGAAYFCRLLDERVFVDGLRAPRILVVGCGAGHEAAAIQAHFDADVDAIDVDLRADDQYRDLPHLTFRRADVCDLPYENEQFDAVFYHHVIEHVDFPAKSICEVARVLRPGGWLFVGTPNRHRLISSVGAHRQLDWQGRFTDKLKGNLRDWKQRLQGRFRNECGAHAGFSQRELDRILASHFDMRAWVTRDYLHFKYANHALARWIDAATHPACCWFTATSIYALCCKPDHE